LEVEVPKGGNNLLRSLVLTALLAVLAACGTSYEQLPTAEFVSPEEGPGPNYIIGPGDSLQIFVWRNPELSTGVVVRPDGRITVPLIEDLPATGRTPTQLARDIEGQLKVYIQDPIVSIMVGGFSGPFAQQVRVVGEASSPKAIPYRANMTLLDLMIATGGLTEFAAGNRAVLVRLVEGKQEQFSVRLDDLIKDGDISANVGVLPGDVLIIPESWF
jgi:polysaccharide export outer membrane protein